jgi:hypothetical protein
MDDSVIDAPKRDTASAVLADRLAPAPFARGLLRLDDLLLLIGP